MAVENALDVDDVAVVEQPRPISGTIFQCGAAQFAVFQVATSRGA